MRFKSNTTSVLLLAVLFLAPLYSVYAQDSNSTGSGFLRQDIKTQNQQQKIDTAKRRFEDRIVGMKERIASREAEFKLRLDNFNDKLKSQIAQRINKNLNLINQNQTSMMSKHLDTMTSILDRAVAKAQGNASSSAQVIAARSTLDSAKTTVINQALKDYTVNVSTESAIRQDVQTTREKLYADLKITRESVLGAKQAVLIAIRSIFSPGLLATPSGTLKSRESTSTGLPVNQ